uniref:tRNA-binding domain-containing protein n=1 Tax=Ostreococcus sp. 'lucimarinus' TaxID=242159 RepID=A0A6U0AYE0_9CHLO|mmetsp:Transcript_2912/g.11228  ORF Transcript_2912/g.11228 Transcript_2912/m.11228 type:complete len:172 (+) Transcript_2912:31-546(+)
MSDDDDDDGAPLCCGEILACVAIDGHDALRLLTIDCGGDAPLKIATNAPNVDVGKKIVVARAGATLRDGTRVTARRVGGVVSEGVVCDSTMVGWSGGGAGTAALLPRDHALGARAPKTRPRLDGKTTDEGARDAAARETQKAREREEKKAALAAKRAARDAKKAAKKDGES